MDKYDKAINSMNNLNMVLSITESERNSVNLAIEVLQQAKERESGCKHCNVTIYKLEEQNYISDEDDEEYFRMIKNNFCPMCGNKLRSENNG